MPPFSFLSPRSARSDQPRRRLAGDGFTQIPQEFFFTKAPPFFKTPHCCPRQQFRLIPPPKKSLSDSERNSKPGRATEHSRGWSCASSVTPGQKKEPEPRQGRQRARHPHPVLYRPYRPQIRAGECPPNFLILNSLFSILTYPHFCITWALCRPFYGLNASLGGVYEGFRRYRGSTTRLKSVALRALRSRRCAAMKNTLACV